MTESIEFCVMDVKAPDFRNKKKRTKEKELWFQLLAMTLLFPCSLSLLTDGTGQGGRKVIGHFGLHLSQRLRQGFIESGHLGWRRGHGERQVIGWGPG